MYIGKFLLGFGGFMGLVRLVEVGRTLLGLFRSDSWDWAWA
jgi:hypothetical protein